MKRRARESYVSENNRRGSSGKVDIRPFDGVKALADTGPAPRSCQWLHGRPADRDFCGEPVKEGSPYCAEHHARCYRLAQREEMAS